MGANVPLNEMSLEEKLQLMEALDLTRNETAMESPDWHRAVLELGAQKIASGEAQFSDWEQAKADIRKRVS